MKKLILVLPLLIMTRLWAQDTRGSQPINVSVGDSITELYQNSYALLIGNSQYENNGWNNLPGVIKDLTEIKKALIQHDFNVKIEYDLNKNQLQEVIEKFISEFGQELNNRLLIYYAGHGETLYSKARKTDMGYLVPVDAPNKSDKAFKRKALPMSRIIEYAKEIESKHALFMFDACFSGSLFTGRSGSTPEFLNNSINKYIRYFITSGDAGQTVPDISDFRKELVNALTTNIADLKRDGYLTEEELGLYLAQKIPEYGKQNPQKGAIKESNLAYGDFVFVLPAPYGPKSILKDSDEISEELNEGRKIQYKAITEILNTYFNRVDNVHRTYKDIGNMALEEQSFFDELKSVVMPYNKIFESIERNNQSYQLEFEQFWGKAKGLELQKIFSAILNDIHKKYIFEGLNDFMKEINEFRKESSQKRWSKKKRAKEAEVLAINLNKVTDSLKVTIDSVNQKKVVFLNKLYSEIN